MAVEIRILSGARQGERLLLEGRELRVGCDRNCEVLFDVARDPAISGRSAVIHLSDDGWYLHATGGQVWVNQQPVARSTRLRSGDIVRMSESGPDFSFGIVAAAAPWWTGPVDVPGHGGVFSGAAAAADATQPAGKGDRHLLPERPAGCSAQKVPVPFSSSAQPSPLPPGTAASVHAAVEPQAAVGNNSISSAAPTIAAETGQQFARPAARPASDGWRWAVWLLAGTAAVIVLLIVMRAISPPTIVVNVGQPNLPATSPVSSPRLGNSAPEAPVSLPGSAATEDQKQVADSGGNSEPAAGKGRGGEPEKPVAAAKPAEPAVPEPPKKDRDAELRTKLDGAVFMIEVEKGAGASRSAWPFATCVAVGDKVLLTTAREAAKLAEWRQQKTFDKIWVTRQSAGVKEEVEDIRVAADYAAVPESTDDWIYVNLGLLTVRNKLPAVASLASPEELAKLKLGTSVACFGFSPAAKVITEEDAYKPLLTRGQVLRIAVSNLPGQPWRLHVQAELPPNLYGSPVVNSDGKLVGLYAEKEASPVGAAGAAAGLNDMHLITLINPTAIDQALRDPSGKAWVQPAVPPTPKTHDGR
jgi:hypothetical protein